MNFTRLFITVSVLIIGLAFLLRNMSRKCANKYILLCIRIYKGLVVGFILSFLVIEGMLVIQMSQFKEVEEIEPLEYVLVLGAGLNGEEVGSVLKFRLDETIKYYDQNKDTHIIVSGGQGEDEVISEALAMERYLVSQGVELNQIIKEDKSTTTLENVKFTKEILKARNDEDKKVLIVTNDFHLPRARLIGSILGMANEGLASSTSVKLRINYMLREYPTMIIDIGRTYALRYKMNKNHWE